MTYNSALADEITGIITMHPEQHDQGNWVCSLPGRLSPLHARMDCGTRACVAGWAAILTLPDTWILGGGDVAWDFTHDKNYRKAVSYSDIGREALGLTRPQAHWLFASYRSHKQVLWALKWLGDNQDADQDDLEYGWECHRRDELA